MTSPDSRLSHHSNVISSQSQGESCVASGFCWRPRWKSGDQTNHPLGTESMMQKQQLIEETHTPKLGRQGLGTKMVPRACPGLSLECLILENLPSYLCEVKEERETRVQGPGLGTPKSSRKSLGSPSIQGLSDTEDGRKITLLSLYTGPHLTHTHGDGAGQERDNSEPEMKN